MYIFSVCVCQATNLYVFVTYREFGSDLSNYRELESDLSN